MTEAQPVTRSDLIQIIAQAASLWESLNNRLGNTDAVSASEQHFGNQRLAHWCQVVAQGNWKKFQKRLDWDGLEKENMPLLLGRVSQWDDRNLPSWAETLRQIIQTTTAWTFPDAGTDSSHNLSPKSCLDQNHPLPFEDVLLPALQVARQSLVARLGLASFSPDQLPLKLLAEPAYLSLERSLLEQLANLSGKTLNLEFAQARPLGYSLLSLLEAGTTGKPSKIHYNAFVQKLLQDGLLAFFQKYPVLGRLIATAINFWVEATADFLLHLQADLAEIQQVFSDSEQLQRVNGATLAIAKVIHISASLSDLHNQGRSVIALTFESGLKLIYKPKDLGLETAYTQFLDWCNQHNVPLGFKVLKVLNRQGYGWVEYIEQQACEDEAAAQRFYQRAGMLLCLLYVLGTNDCHHENLIASGEHLVLIDMETLLHHEAHLMEDSAPISAVNQHLWDSVLRTGLLPRWDFSQDDRIAYDISGLGSGDSQQFPRRIQQVLAVNTDEMHLVHENVPMPVLANVPMLHGVALSANDYLDEFVDGFEQMYRFLIQQRQALLASNSPLTALRAQQVRFVFRPTRIYSVVLSKTLAPEFLRNGIDRSIELDILSRAYLAIPEKPQAWSILQAELRAMEQFDIPYFSAASDSDALVIGLDLPITRFFKQPSYNQCILRLQQLDRENLAQQVAIIQGAFYAKAAKTSETGKLSEPNAVNFTQPNWEQISPLTSEQLLQQANQIAQEIEKRAFRGIDGSVNWIGLGYVPNAERFQLQILGDSLYDGNCGIALFLAALARITGSNQYRDLALGAWQFTAKFLQTAEPELSQRFARQIGIGGTSGLSSLIYSLVKISQFLQEPVLLEDAQRVANLITPELIAADRGLDIISGAAGAILGLLALYQETGKPEVLQRAIACGQHLLMQQISSDGSPKAWKTFTARPLTGFSHGAGGIAYSLLQLYGVTQDSAYLEAACEGITYEGSVFSKAATNWPDFRSVAKSEDQPGFMVSWCHGATGIGLARLGGLAILATDAIHQDIEAALQSTLMHGGIGVDNVCCGTFGQVEMLLVASQKLCRPDLQAIAQQRAAWIVAKAEQTGGYQLFANLPNSVFNPTFFQGTSGIGYQLLRLAAPAKLPSVLLWE